MTAVVVSRRLDRTLIQNASKKNGHVPTRNGQIRKTGVP